MESSTAKTSTNPASIVAKIAAEVAARLPDYVVLHAAPHASYSYRTADAQEMIERAFAGLFEQEKQSSREAREMSARNEERLQAENTELRAELERARGGK